MWLLAASDLFATKGIEYLLVILFLVALASFWWLLGARDRGRAAAALARAHPSRRRFALPADLHYHPGHGWARPAGDDIVRVGIDDFAQKLLGPFQALMLPAVGSRVEQGAPACAAVVDSRPLELLCPVGGTIVARNESLERDPGRVNRDPYDEGWLLTIRTDDGRRNLRNLLHGEAAGAWLAATERELMRRVSPQLGTVLQDGGLPVNGLARAISADGWERLVREFLGTG